MKTLMAVLFVAALAGAAVGADATRPDLLFREDWKENAAVTPVTQEHVANPDLILTRHGPGEGKIRKSHHDKPADDPFYVWSGEAEANWALSLSHARLAMDLTGNAKIRWRARHAHRTRERNAVHAGAARSGTPGE